MLETISSSELNTLELQPPKMIVHNLLSVGLNILAGNPKSGKSFLSLKLGHSVATGYRFLNYQVIQGQVLYLALEDTLFRLKSRMRGLKLPPTDNLHFATYSPKLADGGLQEITNWAARSDTQLIIIDTLGRVKDEGKGGNVYQEDTDLGSALQQTAFNNDIAIMVIHHMRKQSHKDFLLSVSGSAGLVGAADVVLGLERKRNSPDGTLHVTGRDIEERQIGLYWNQSMGTGWERV